MTEVYNCYPSSSSSPSSSSAAAINRGAATSNGMTFPLAGHHDLADGNHPSAAATKPYLPMSSQASSSSSSIPAYGRPHSAGGLASTAFHGSSSSNNSHNKRDYDCYYQQQQQQQPGPSSYSSSSANAAAYQPLSPLTSSWPAQLTRQVDPNELASARAMDIANSSSSSGCYMTAKTKQRSISPTSHQRDVTAAAAKPPSQQFHLEQRPPAASVGSSPIASSSRRPDGRSSLDDQARWFAQTACWIWFSPASSNLEGVSSPGTPCRSPTSAFQPAYPSPLAARRPSHAKTSSQDGFSTLALSSLGHPSDKPVLQVSDLDNRLNRVAGNGFDELPRDPRLQPRSRFVAFVKDTLRTTQVSISVLILALLYIRRLKLQHPQLKGHEGSEYRLCVTALMLANKFLDDHTYTNKTWSDISGISLKDVTKMEVEFWLGLQMRIHVSVQDYDKWMQTLDDLREQRAQAMRKRDRDQTRRKAAAAVAAAANASTLALQASSPRHASSLRNSFSFTSPAMMSWGETMAAALGGDHAPALYSASTPGPFYGLDGASSLSPDSHQSFSSTVATSVNNEQASCWSPQKAATGGSRHLSPHDAHVGRALSSASSSGWPAQAGTASRKRSRADSTNESAAAMAASASLDSDTRARKRLHLPSSASAISSDYHPGVVGQQYAPSHPMEPSPSTDAFAQQRPTSATSSSHQVSPQELQHYRSAFFQSQTPQRLLQSYSGPLTATYSSAWPSQDEPRPLSYWQLAAGSGYGNFTYHLPPPHPMPNGPSANSGAMGLRRGSLNLNLSLAPYSVSPVPGPQSSFGSSGLSAVMPTHSYSHQPQSALPLGQQSSKQSRLSSALPTATYPARLSPEAYGCTYGSQPGRSYSTAAYAGANDSRYAPEPWAPSTTSASTSKDGGYPSGCLHGNSRRESSSYSAAPPPEGSERRWMPFSNVPIGLHLQQAQQWQQLQQSSSSHQPWSTRYNDFQQTR